MFSFCYHHHYFQLLLQCDPKVQGALFEQGKRDSITIVMSLEYIFILYQYVKSFPQKIAQQIGGS